MARTSAILAMAALAAGVQAEGGPASGPIYTFDPCGSVFESLGIRGEWTQQQTWYDGNTPPIAGTFANGKWTIDLSGTDMAVGAKFKMIGDGTELPNIQSGTDACSPDWNERIRVEGVTMLTLGCLDNGSCPAQAPNTVTFKVQQCTDTYEKVGLQLDRPGEGEWWNRAQIEMAKSVGDGGAVYHSVTLDNTMNAGASYKYFAWKESDPPGNANWEVMVNIESGTATCSPHYNERHIAPGGWGQGNDNADTDVEGCLDNGQCPTAEIAQPDTFTLHYNSCKPAQVSYQFEGMPGAAANWWEQEPIVAVQGSNNIHVLTFPNAATGDFFPTRDNKYKVLVDGEAPNIEQDKAGLVHGNANCHAQYNEYTIKRQWEEPQDMYGCPADNVCPSFAPYVEPPATFTFTFNACYHDVVEEGDGTVGYILDDSPGEGNWYERAPIPATRGEGNTYTLTFPHESTGDYMPKMDVRYKIVVNDGESAVDVERSAKGGHGHANCHAQYNEYTLDSSANSWVEPMDVNGCPETNTCDHLQAPVAKTGVLAGMFVGRVYHDAVEQVGRKVEDATDCMAACNTINNNVALACGYWTFDYMVGTCKYGAGKENPMPDGNAWFGYNADAVSGPPSLESERAIAVAHKGCFASNSIYQGQSYGACGWAGLSTGTSFFVRSQADVDRLQGEAWMSGEVKLESVLSAADCQAKCDEENARPESDGDLFGQATGQPKCDFFEWGGSTGADAFFCFLKIDSGCTGEHLSLKPGSVVGPAVCDGTVYGQVAVETDESTEGPATDATLTPTDDSATTDPDASEAPTDQPDGSGDGTEDATIETTCETAVVDWVDAEGLGGIECPKFKCAAVVALFADKTCDAFCTKQGLACVAAWDDVVDESCDIQKISQIQGCDFDFGTALVSTSDAVCMCGVGPSPKSISEALGIDSATAATGSLAALALATAVFAAMAF